MPGPIDQILKYAPDYPVPTVTSPRAQERLAVQHDIDDLLESNPIQSFKGRQSISQDEFNYVFELKNGDKLWIRNNDYGMAFGQQQPGIDRENELIRCAKTNEFPWKMEEDYCTIVRYDKTTGWHVDPVCNK